MYHYTKLIETEMRGEKIIIDHSAMKSGIFSKHSKQKKFYLFRVKLIRPGVKILSVNLN